MIASKPSAPRLISQDGVPWRSVTKRRYSCIGAVGWALLQQSVAPPPLRKLDRTARWVGCNSVIIPCYVPSRLCFPAVARTAMKPIPLCDLNDYEALTPSASVAPTHDGAGRASDQTCNLVESASRVKQRESAVASMFQ